MDLDLNNKVAIVTGGNSGIGKAIAVKLLEEGSSVIVMDKHLDQETGLIESNHYFSYAYSVDVTDKKNVVEVVKNTVQKFGKVDILINNAGVFRDEKLIHMTEEDWNLVLDVNLKGTFNCIQAVSPFMMKQKYGKIVNVSSISYKGNYGQANYSASKAGIVSLTKTAAMEFAPYVNVNCVTPGPINTPLFQSMNEKSKNKWVNKIPLGKVAEPEDVANCVLFLSSDVSKFVTGVILDVDGGLTAGINLR
ncbi:SDR family NAD(P)-dependent oxidoreductase [Chengkuizengella axinellae]|uniref:3-oxoacyl-ACP reductase FabG n=1 Tax=Chengkuizengella axinellae TaxID=3064388 RepID=A0ABT9J202_9BACL|nr:3-oxoacyl-ACP reductase FabG [Chengkuizengella sp. 2205SS18-9]MDP5275622.1 3-oxoacyl-ACP reductase FabG [Chengkuizengella sp. 2205SS18-9]